MNANSFYLTKEGCLWKQWLNDQIKRIEMYKVRFLFPSKWSLWKIHNFSTNCLASRYTSPFCPLWSHGIFAEKVCCASCSCLLIGEGYSEKVPVNLQLCLLFSPGCLSQIWPKLFSRWGFAVTGSVLQPRNAGILLISVMHSFFCFLLSKSND